MIRATVVVLCLASLLTAAPLPPEVPVGDSLETISTTRLVKDLRASNGWIRTTATRELFRRHHRVQESLKDAGARNLYATFFAPSPTRLDMIFTLLEGKQGHVLHRDGEFVLQVEEGVTQEDVARMGRRYGFVASELAASDDRPAKSKACRCAVRRVDDVAMERAIYHVLVDEPRVISAGLTYAW
jgi:hypothetical protein